MIVDIEQVLKERNGRYGGFYENARLSQGLKHQIRSYHTPELDGMCSEHREAIEMILHKISRIVCGDAHYTDSWVDIQGYAKLGEDACVTKAKE